MSTRTHKRHTPAPLPIFSKGRRPRQALVAHPNNMGGSMQEAPHWKSSASQQSRPQEKQGRYPQQMTPACPLRPQLPSYGCSNSAELENRVHHRNYSTQQRGFTPYEDQCSTSHVACSPHTPSHKPSGRFGAMISKPTPEHLVTPTSLMPVPLTPRTPSTVQEPQASRLDSSLANDFQRKSSTACTAPVRILTATAKGMQYWSKYKHYTQMLFEVFASVRLADPFLCVGVVSSPMSVGSTNAKEFHLKTSDGVVKCLFWEIDCKLPHLVRGHVHRVVGEWDVSGQCLKCYSVRSVRGREGELARSWVETSDKNMRQMVATIPEM